MNIKLEEREVAVEELVEVTFSGNEYLRELAKQGKAPKYILVNGEEFKLIEHEEKANLNSYYVSKSAKVYSIYTNNYLKPQRHGFDYYHLMLKREEDKSYKYKFPLHQIVAYTYLGEAPEGMVVHHKDNNYLNNDLSNLEIITQSDNSSRENIRRIGNVLAEVLYTMYLDDGEGFSIIEVAEEYNLSVQALERLISGDTYKKVVEEVFVSRKKAEGKELKNYIK